MSSNQNNQTGNGEGTQDKGISRRRLLQYTCGCMGAAALMTIGGSADAFAAGGAHQTGLPQEGDLLVIAEGDRKGQPVSMDDLKEDAAPLLVLPKDPKGAIREEENSKILLFRTTPDKLAPSVKSASVQGVIAYSALCTHLGCVLSSWNADKKLMVCPCHDATFDPYDKANFTNPGPRPLPVLPIKIENSQFIVTDDFSGWVGAKET